MPSIVKSGFKFSLIKLIVFKSCPKPSIAKYSHCIGINTEPAAVNALTVKSPNDGGQSINI